MIYMKNATSLSLVHLLMTTPNPVKLTVVHHSLNTNSSHVDEILKLSLKIFDQKVSNHYGSLN